MSLDEDLATTADVTGVFVAAARRRAELGADLRAVGAGAFATRPSILRRAAAVLAQDLPTATDRLVTTGDTDAVALTTALALHTGLPFAVVAGQNRPDLQRGDRVAVITPVADDTAAALADRVRAGGAEPLGPFSVLDADGTPAFTA
ncbi:hypothetical protein VSH64_06690 [Amycolatopsis rhabdoformis]|uniref:Uncharacterized protein n=1 Tax=Amycolatopsis rhabdoformis TaxID=1448059 RepID=A0ABZ1IDP9_9PSEU|nr:hypothetical protein [Amycolatopsis rhabdoformis]WSE31793.1 hypothetical protein VSH64_06690 [Amycolatopsis rhabdoformis]